MTDTQTQELLATVARLQAELAAAKAPKIKQPTVDPSTTIDKLPFGYHRSRVLRNMGFMNIPLLIDGKFITVAQYREAVAVYVAAHPKKAKTA